MRNLVQTLKLSGSTAAMVAATICFGSVAHAQNTAPVEQVEVTASRISVAGYTAPTPVTVVDSASIARDAKVDLGATIRELPAVGQSWSPDTGSNGGQGSQGDADLNTINLRDLGNIRTLVLFDGQRVVMSNPNNGTPPFAIGGVDLNTIPQTVIQRVEVVTGGASAAWGSDAVAGVVNLVIDKTFTGIKANLTFSDSYLDDHRQYKAEIFVGSDFLGGRAHVEFAGNYLMSPDLVKITDRGWYWGQPQSVPSASLKAIGMNVTGLPTWVRIYNAIGQSGSARQTNGGLITANPKGTLNPNSANILAGIQFIGPNAQPAPFNFGAVNGSNCYYCSGTPYNNTGLNQLAVPYHNFALFNYDSYKLTDNITASIQLNYGQSFANSTSSGRNGNVIIHDDNPFIPAPVKAIMTTNGITSFTLGTSNANNLNLSTLRMNDIGQATGLSLVTVQRQLMRGVFSLNGAFSLLGNDWTWNAYAQSSTVRQRERLPYNTIAQNYSNATDPITVAAAGKNSLGSGNAVLAAQVTAALKAQGAHIPQVGEIACRSTLTATSWGTVTDPATGLTTVLPGGLTPNCAPLDQFGEGVASTEAQNYIAPGRVNPAYEDTGFWYMGQAVYAISAQGQLPWGLPAGRLAVATGYEHRLEQQTNKRDPLNLGSTGAYPSGNFASWQGHYYVDEGFLEVDAPLLKNNFVETLDFNAAGRITDYSTSGMVQTWKVGLTSQVNDDFRLRGTWSADIRAPDVSELFSAPLFAVTGNSYPPPDGPLYQSHVANSGNPNLVPEEAITLSGGVVLTPHWIENLSISLDWYSISIHKAIYANALADILHQCAIGNPTFCANVFFGKGFPGNTNLPVAQEIDGNGKPATGFFASLGTFPADCESCFNLAFISPLNAASETTSGLDFQADYRMTVWDNPLSWHLVGNYTDERTNTVLGIKFDGAGIYGGSGFVNPLSGLTSPKMRFNLSATYDLDPYEFTVQSRFIGSARVSNTYVTGVDIDHNWIPPVAYLDLRASYQWTNRTQLYFAVDNTLNTPPAMGAGSQGGLGQIYDELGRSFRVGVRFSD
jgi:outer membrane receptor protein involved in Fe transport